MDTNVDIWFYDKPEKGKKRFAVKITNTTIKNRILRWNNTTLGPCYFSPEGKIVGWDVFIPAKLYDRAAKLIGAPLKKKNPLKVELGKKLGAKAVENNHLRLNKPKNGYQPPNSGLFYNDIFRKEPV